MTIDLNCDVGEGAGNDAELIPHISSANIACGAHAGDEATMRETFALAMAAGTTPGAHPGFPDREHFGRREMPMDLPELRATLLHQLTALRQVGAFRYVKPHGALYNLAARDEAVAQVVVETVADFDAELGLMALAGSKLLHFGRDRGLITAAEAFADRAYTAKGALVSRGQPGAVLDSETAAVEQVLEMVQRGRVRAISGEWVPVQADSICVHGDNPQAVAFVQGLRQGLAAAGVEIKSNWTDA